MEITGSALGREGLVEQEAEEEPVTAFVGLQGVRKLQASAASPRSKRRIGLAMLHAHAAAFLACHLRSDGIGSSLMHRFLLPAPRPMQQEMIPPARQNKASSNAIVACELILSNLR